MSSNSKLRKSLSEGNLPDLQDENHLESDNLEQKAKSYVSPIEVKSNIYYFWRKTIIISSLLHKNS